MCGVAFFSEKNNLSFIETSALDSTNVEEAFKNILTGRDLLYGGKNHLAYQFISIIGKILYHRSCWYSLLQHFYGLLIEWVSSVCT